MSLGFLGNQRAMTYLRLAVFEVMLQSSRPKETIQAELEAGRPAGRCNSGGSTAVDDGPGCPKKFVGGRKQPPALTEHVCCWLVLVTHVTHGNPYTVLIIVQVAQLPMLSLEAFLQDESGPFTSWLCVAWREV